MNLALGFLEIVFVFGIVVATDKWIGREGLIAWVGIAVVIANLQVCKAVDILNLNLTLGNVAFASTFLATDILSEKYGDGDARKAVNVGLLSAGIFVVLSQLTRCFTPNSLDIASPSMDILFSFSARTSLASLTMLYLANLLDVKLFALMKKRDGESRLWLRNNVCTIVSNCGENFFFNFLAFGGIYPFKDILMIALCTSVVECAIAICDTPFVYLSKWKVEKKQVG